MAKLSVNEVKYIDKMQETVDKLKKPRFRNVGEYGKYLKSIKDTTRDQRAIIVYSVLDMVESAKHQWGEMNNDKLMAILRPIGEECGIALQEMLKILMHLLSDPTYFVKIGKEFKATFGASN
jgi:hypothetical protein